MRAERRIEKLVKDLRWRFFVKTAFLGFKRLFGKYN